MDYQQEAQRQRERADAMMTMCRDWSEEFCNQLAINADLVAALEALMQRVQDPNAAWALQNDPETVMEYRDARAALAKARGER